MWMLERRIGCAVVLAGLLSFSVAGPANASEPPGPCNLWEVGENAGYYKTDPNTNIRYECVAAADGNGWTWVPV